MNLYAQVGIGTTIPKAFFNVADGKDVLFGKDVSGVGTKLIWYGSKGAFRAGYVDGTQWDIDQVGVNSFATGVRATASGFNTVAMGSNVSTNNNVGSFIFGDTGGVLFTTTGANQMVMRFGEGYTLYTSSNGQQASTVGVKVASGGNAWQTLSDSTRKENFRIADGASFLQKIARMRLGSWNYKGQDAGQYRHYGPMAQDFFAAFGHDELGVIGEDRSINQADFDGVNLIAIQALIKKVEKLEAENAALKQQVSETASLKSDMEQIKKQLATLLKQ
ncbi:hypothetical protein GCM10028773_30750 [Spirosoma koreense]